MEDAEFERKELYIPKMRTLDLDEFMFFISLGTGPSVPENLKLAGLTVARVRSLPAELKWLAGYVRRLNRAVLGPIYFTQEINADPDWHASVEYQANDLPYALETYAAIVSRIPLRDAPKRGYKSPLYEASQFGCARGAGPSVHRANKE